jgi:hypothetical protein
MQPHALPPDQSRADGLVAPTARPCPLRCVGGIKGGAQNGAALALLLLLAACAPNLGDKPAPQDPANFATAESFKAPAADWPKQDWWKAYGDPQLDGLIEEALKDSPSLKAAAARVRAAEAEAGTAQADLWPTLNASGELQEY